MICRLLQLLLVPMVVVPVSAQEGAVEMSRAEKETFLKKSRVVSMEEVGEGVSNPWKVKLERDGVQMKAIYKNIDMRMETAFSHGSETADEYMDSYKSEIAAYELDKLIGIEILPVIVERKVKGKKGSLREWVEDVMPRYGHGNRPPLDNRLSDWLHTVWLFDYLIYNTDRGTHNIMIATDWSPVVIDNSIAFNTFQKPIRILYRFPREVVDRLRTLEKKSVDRALRRYLKRHQIDALWNRMQNVLKTVDHRKEQFGEQEVYFSLPELGSN